MALTFGARPDLFKAATHDRPDFSFGSLGGRYILMAFLPETEADHRAALQALIAAAPGMTRVDRLAFGVIGNAAQFSSARNASASLGFFHDPDGAIARRFELTEGERREGHLFLLDPTLRVLIAAPISQAALVHGQMAAAPPVDAHAGVPLHAPVMIVPRVFEPDFCRRLIEVYQQQGGERSGVMREIDGRTVGVIDDFKSRKDTLIQDPALIRQIQLRIFHRLLPEIEKAFAHRLTRMERYIVSRYDAEEGGYFKAHRDNTTKGTAHRQFACSINLNAEEFEGGDLRFPEFGTRVYRPPTGGAVIFSCSLLHEATPVTKGTRFAFLPFFYNDAHAKIRDENRQFLSSEVRDNTSAPAAPPAA